ncbi:hemolysin XhlA family protein [Sutcliffiella horikoshii]|uniref:hemolysin XhlA family protein n=1 Tax=Sutcliffiella horikoshii TaxID=79883 RepID=UPI0007D09E76|nr:hemolysin XhlA family protein [Sutcliffiella horikoshii]MCM3620520.1 hemolysin XhlA family protein [Sutcliffiella horikoshii]
MEAQPMNKYDEIIAEMKGDIKVLETKYDTLNEKTIRHDEQINSINNTLDSINENTKWIKRTITGAIITAIISGIILGAIAIFYTVLQN